MVKIFLEFSDFGREYLRVWPNSYLVAGISYLVEEKFRRRFRRGMLINAEKFRHRLQSKIRNSKHEIHKKKNTELRTRNSE